MLEIGEHYEKIFTLEYWIDDDWYVGQLKGVPGVFSQGETFQELKDNIQDACQLMMEEFQVSPPAGAQTTELRIRV